MARSQSLDETSLDLEHTPKECVRKMIKKIYPNGYIFGPKREKEKDEKNHVFDAYMCRRLKDQDVGTTFSCLILARTRKR